MQLSLILALIPLALASPVSLLKRDAVYCGNQYYSDSAVSDAANAACSYVQSGSEAGSSTYPHTYNNYEGFDFPVSEPYDEFPILASGDVYSGGSPGRDRVVINQDCELAGVITHTGASGDDFVGCDSA